MIKIKREQSQNSEIRIWKIVYYSRSHRNKKDFRYYGKFFVNESGMVDKVNKFIKNTRLTKSDTRWNRKYKCLISIRKIESYTRNFHMKIRLSLDGFNGEFSQIWGRHNINLTQFPPKIDKAHFPTCFMMTTQLWYQTDTTRKKIIDQSPS